MKITTPLSKATKIFLGSAFTLGYSLFGMIASMPAAAAACDSLPTDKGVVTMNVTVPATGNYRVWLRMKAPSAVQNGVYLQIADAGACRVTVGHVSTPANEWNWVDYQNGNAATKINANLTAGAHTIVLSGLDEGVLADKMLLLSNDTCTPTSDGTNCMTSSTPVPTPAPTPTPTTTTVINEAFGSSTTSMHAVAGGTWGVAGGRYALSNAANPADSKVGNSNISLADYMLGSAYTFTADVNAAASSGNFDDTSVIFNYRDPSNYYYVSLNESSDDYTNGLFKIVGGVQTRLVGFTAPTTAGADHHVKVVRDGASIKVYRDDVLLADTTDSSFSGGQVGVGSRNNNASFDNLVATVTGSPTSPASLIAENFDAANANFATTGGAWSVTGGHYVLTGAATNSVSNANLALHRTSISGDFTLTSQGSATSSTSTWDDFSVIFDYTGPNDYYYASFNENNDDSTNGIFKIAGGVKTQLADFSSTITPGTLYAVKIERAADSIKVYRDGVLVGTTNDSSYHAGQVGFGTRNNNAIFDGLSVSAGVR